MPGSATLSSRSNVNAESEHCLLHCLYTNDTQTYIYSPRPAYGTSVQIMGTNRQETCSCIKQLLCSGSLPRAQMHGRCSTSSIAQTASDQLLQGEQAPRTASTMSPKLRKRQARPMGALVHRQDSTVCQEIMSDRDTCNCSKILNKQPVWAARLKIACCHHVA